MTDALYPDGAHGLLGYGLDLPSGVNTSASLLASFVPYVNLFLVPIVAADNHRSERMLPMQCAVSSSTIWTILFHRVFLRWVQSIHQRKHCQPHQVNVDLKQFIFISQIRRRIQQRERTIGQSIFVVHPIRQVHLYGGRYCLRSSRPDR